MSQKTHYLQDVAAFRDLSFTEVETISQRTTLAHYRAGHLFYLPNDPGDALFILKKGRVQLYRMSPDGRKFIVAILNAGDIFGHMALVGQRMHNTFAEALEDCTICIWNSAEVEQVLREKPQVALRLLEAVGQRLSDAERRLEEMTFKRIPARMAGLLIQLNREQGCTGAVQGYTHQQLADILGAYRETVTQTLNEFKEQELIRVSRKVIEILDLLKLQNVAES